MVNKTHSGQVFIILIVACMITYRLYTWLLTRSNVRATLAANALAEQSNSVNEPFDPKPESNPESNSESNPESKRLESQSLLHKPTSYYRYQSNTCDPKQDTLPITFPDPNEDLDPFEPDPLWDFIKYGSISPEMHGTLNYCQ
jgi:hypothetical protein